MSDAGMIKRGTLGASTVTIGRYTYGYEQMAVKQWGEGSSLTIGAFCSLADNLTVMLGGNHRIDWATTFPFGHVFETELGGDDIVGHPKSNGDVVIGNDVWIGRGATIMSGVTLGDGAVIAANSTVVKDVGCYEVWGGNPAKLIKKRFSQEVIDRLLELGWWNCDAEAIKRVAPLLSQCPTIESVEEVSALLHKSAEGTHRETAA